MDGDNLRKEPQGLREPLISATIDCNADDYILLARESVEQYLPAREQVIR
jgi:hypothetical protein